VSGFYTVGAEVGSPLTAVELITCTAIGYDRGVLLEWRTGYEAHAIYDKPFIINDLEEWLSCVVHV